MKKTINKIVPIVFSLLGIFLIAVCTSILIAIQRAPNFLELRNSVKIRILLNNGTESFKIIGPKAHGWVSLENISNYAITAIIAAEDTSFFYHKGIDLYEIREAIKKDIREKRWARGASTITQQVIKNVYLTSEKSIFRKILEIIWAWKLEKILSKSEILCFYLNMAEFGPGIYGIQHAASYYFNLSPAQLNIKQSAFLAMLLPSPRKYHMYFVNKSLSKWAQERIIKIIRVMNKLGFISNLEHESAISEKLWEDEKLNTDFENLDENEAENEMVEPEDKVSEPEEIDEPIDRDSFEKVLELENE